jgi:hypothetical protein
VNVKWGKEKFTDVELNTDEPPEVFKAQLFALSGVQPDRQKVMMKGAVLKVGHIYVDRFFKATLSRKTGLKTSINLFTVIKCALCVGLVVGVKFALFGDINFYDILCSNQLQD